MVSGGIDKKGNFVVEPVYNEVYGYIDGLGQIAKDGKWGQIAKNGEVVLEPKYDFVGMPSEGLAMISVNDKYGFIVLPAFKINLTNKVFLMLLA